MKIAVLSTFPPKRCGIAYVTNNLFEALRAQGHELVTIGIDGAEGDFTADSHSTAGMLAAAEFIRRQDVDAVSVQFIIGFYGKKNFGLNYLRFLRALRGVRVVTTLHELHAPSFARLLRHPADLAHFAIEWAVARASSGVILHTDIQAAQLRAWGVPQTRRVYLGIQTRDIARAATPGKRALFFGKINPAKGVHLFPEIARARPDFEFRVVVSVEPQQAAYADEVARLFEGVPNLTLVRKDWIEDAEKDAYFTEADVLVLPYLDARYQSGVAAEGGVYNIPVIVPRMGPLSEVTEKYPTGIAVSRAEPAEIADALTRISEDYPRYLAGIRRYREDAAWPEVARRYADFLRG